MLVVVNFPANVEIGDLRQSFAFKFRRKIMDGQHRIGELQPVWFDTPGIETGEKRAGSSHD